MGASFFIFLILQLTTHLVEAVECEVGVGEGKVDASLELRHGRGHGDTLICRETIENKKRSDHVKCVNT